MKNNKTRIVVDRNDNSWMLHSLNSCEYLKIDDNNFILIQENKDNKCRIIQVQDQHKDSNGDTMIHEIYKLKI